MNRRSFLARIASLPVVAGVLAMLPQASIAKPAAVGRYRVVVGTSALDSYIYDRKGELMKNVKSIKLSLRNGQWILDDYLTVEMDTLPNGQPWVRDVCYVNGGACDVEFTVKPSQSFQDGDDIILNASTRDAFLQLRRTTEEIIAKMELP